MASITYLKIDGIYRTHLKFELGVHRDEQVHRRANVGHVDERAAQGIAMRFIERAGDLGGGENGDALGSNAPRHGRPGFELRGVGSDEGAVGVEKSVGHDRGVIQIRDAQQSRHFERRRSREYLSTRTGLQYAPFADDDYFVREKRRLFGVVCDEEGGETGLALQAA